MSNVAAEVIRERGLAILSGIESHRRQYKFMNFEYPDFLMLDSETWKNLVNYFIEKDGIGMPYATTVMGKRELEGMQILVIQATSLSKYTPLIFVGKRA